MGSSWTLEFDHVCLLTSRDPDPLDPSAGCRVRYLGSAAIVFVLRQGLVMQGDGRVQHLDMTCLPLKESS